MPQWLLNISNVLLLWCDVKRKHLQLNLCFISGHWISLLFGREMHFRVQCGTVFADGWDNSFCIEVLDLSFFWDWRAHRLKLCFHQHCSREHPSTVQYLPCWCVSPSSCASQSFKWPKWKQDLQGTWQASPWLFSSGQQCVASNIWKILDRLKNWKPEATPLMPV